MSLLILPLIAISLQVVVQGSAATTDTVSPGQALVGGGGGRIVSGNGKFALGFFQAAAGGDPALPPNAPNPWYLGMWYNKLPKMVTVWVANRDDPLLDASSWQLAISGDGNLVVSSTADGSTIWSTRATTTTNDTVAVLLDAGNLVLREASNSSNVLWQSFDHPTDTLLSGAKLSRDKLTGRISRRLVSRKNSVSQATGRYSMEFDPDGSGQLIIAPVNSSSSSPPFWYSGPWNGKYFSSLSEMQSGRANFTYVSNEQEEYYLFTLDEKANGDIILHMVLDISGQMKTMVFGFAGVQEWTNFFSLPSAQCDVYAICGAFTNCQDTPNSLPDCSCMKGFSIRSPQDWELADRSGGCVRNLPLDCGNTTNKSNVSSTDKFYPMACVRLPQNPQVVAARSSSELDCARACLSNCSCTAYSYGDNGCSNWHNELVNVKQQQCNSSSSSNGETLYIRLSAAEQLVENYKKGGVSTGVVIGASLGAVGFLALIMILVIFIRKVSSRPRLYNAQNGGGIAAFRYADLQHATNNFSEKIGGGGFGSVFKGALPNSTTVAVKRLDTARQGEKQFRAEVSSIGTIQHINLVKLIGFCCEGDKRLLVYEHMPNSSLDAHLFRSNVTVLTWSVRYQIALGIARGLAYLHESCRDCIIHCDIKPENILLDASFVPKIADFGMAKFLGRDFSRALTTMRGTIGYLAPEWISGTAITSKVDVYSYGMVLLEIISGTRNSAKESSSSGDHADYFPVQVVQKLLDLDVASLVDGKLQGDVDLKEVERACKVACWCIQDNEFDRPTMVEVVQFLEGILEPNMPPMPRLLHAIAAGSRAT
ncbi:hypothetical protein ACP70R_047784 [Stipagrostis hirtigluma subsp. patula]